jgi:hypothetical protein
MKPFSKIISFIQLLRSANCFVMENNGGTTLITT